MNIPSKDDGRGGVIVHDLDGDGLMDFIVSKPGIVAAYDNHGQKLWIRHINIQLTAQAERNGLPGWHAPGIQAADVDGDRTAEVLFLTSDNQLVILEGHSGDSEAVVDLPSHPAAERWEHLVIADFRGRGDTDLLLQTTNTDGYRMGKYLRAYVIRELTDSDAPQPLWEVRDFTAAAHNGARVADLDGDGRDEVLGGSVISPDGRELFALAVKGHVDAHLVDDILPAKPGLEMVVLEETHDTHISSPFDDLKSGNDTLNKVFGKLDTMYKKLFAAGNRVFLVGMGGQIWDRHFGHREPQTAAVGEFDPASPGLEIWCRSRYDTHQQPFVFGADGNLLARYAMADVAPAGWTEKGVEVLVAIHWTGDGKQLLAGKERHRSGDVAIFDALTGTFLHRFKEQADRLYVADVGGDKREEVIVLNGSQIRIYQNPESDPGGNDASLWDRPHYRRSKTTHNYYSP